MPTFLDYIKTPMVSFSDRVGYFGQRWNMNPIRVLEFDSEVDEEAGLGQSAKKRKKISEGEDSFARRIFGFRSPFGSANSSRSDTENGSTSTKDGSKRRGKPKYGGLGTSLSQKEKYIKEAKFMADLREVIYDFSKLESFMQEVDDHPQHAWHKVLLLFSYERDRTSSTYVKPETAKEFIDELVTNFPDILQRVLLQGTQEPKTGDYSALHIAVLSKQRKIVELLTTVESKELIKQCLLECVKRSGLDGYQAIHRVILWDLLKSSPQDTLRREKVTKLVKAFEIARRPENIESLETLLKEAESQPIEVWYVILQWASSSGEVHIVRSFKERCPKLFASLSESSIKNGLPPFRTSSLKGKDTTLKGQQEICDLIMEIIESKGDNDVGYIELLALNLHGRIKHGWTALHLAVATGDNEMVELLMDCYDKHPIWGNNGERAFEHKLFKGKGNKHNYDPYFTDDFWMTPMHYAVMDDKEKIVTKLLQWPLFKTHINAFNLFMRTSIHVACTDQDRARVLPLLVEDPSIELNDGDCCSFTPLHWSVYGGSPNAIRLLLSRATHSERPVIVSEEDIEGRQAFAMSIENKTWKLLMSLPEVKEEVERLYRDRQVYIDAANAILVGSSLIASVTFGQLQPSAGKAEHIQLYWALASLSFFFSVASMMAGMGAILPMEDVYIGKAVTIVRDWLILSSLLLIICIVLVLGAFTTAGLASLDTSNVSHLTRNLLTTSVVGCVICGLIGLSFVQRLYKICRPRSHKLFLFFLGYIAWVFRCLGNQIAHPLSTSMISAIELDLKEEWDVLGRKYKGREKEWRRFRGIHRLGHISVSSCRKYAIHCEKSAFNKLLDECHIKEDVGYNMFQKYSGDFSITDPSEADEKLEQASTWLQAKMEERARLKKSLLFS